MSKNNNTNQTDLMLYWIIPHCLAGMPAPIETQLEGLRKAGLKVLVSLLDLNAKSCEEEQRLYHAGGFVRVHMPIMDGNPPTLAQTIKFSQLIDKNAAAKQPVGVHCLFGHGRTGTMLASYLVYLGLAPETAIKSVRAKNRWAIETERQERFVKSLPQLLKPQN